jgi:hypothetical protein
MIGKYTAHHGTVGNVSLIKDAILGKLPPASNERVQDYGGVSIIFEQ